MTTQAHGSIIYYDSDGGPILREVTAADVAAMKTERQQIAAALGIKAETYDLLGFVRATVDHLDNRNQALEIVIAENDALQSAYAVASAIMRSQPVCVPPRLVQAWREAQQAVEKVKNATR